MLYTPKLSIGLPVYNGEKFLGFAVDSILSQTYADYEIIISDNCSTDGTPDIGQRFARLDARVRYVRQEVNVGLARNHNHLLQLCSGQYFKWASSDDLLNDDFLKSCVAVLDKRPDVALAYTKSCFIDAKGRLLDIADRDWHVVSDVAADRLRTVIMSDSWCNMIWGVFRAEVLKQTRLIGNYPGGDYRVLAEAAVFGKFEEIPEILLRRRLHDQNTAGKPFTVVLNVFQPYRRFPLAFPVIQRFLDHSNTVVMSELTIGEKMSLMGNIIRRMIWGRKRIVQDVWSLMDLWWQRLNSNYS